MKREAWWALAAVISIALIASIFFLPDRGHDPEQAEADTQQPTRSPGVSAIGSGLPTGTTGSGDNAPGRPAAGSDEPLPHPAQPAEDGSMPQGEPVVAADPEGTIADPRDSRGVIIPESPAGVFAPGEPVTATVSAAGKSGTLRPTQVGLFPTVVITPNSSAQVKLHYPELEPGTAVQLFCPDGGTVDGESKTTLTLDAARSASFTWQGGDNLGRHLVTLFAGPAADEKALAFWVGPRAFADAEAVPR